MQSTVHHLALICRELTERPRNLTIEAAAADELVVLDWRCIRRKRHIRHSPRLARCRILHFGPGYGRPEPTS